MWMRQASDGQQQEQHRRQSNRENFLRSLRQSWRIKRESRRSPSSVRNFSRFFLVTKLPFGGIFRPNNKKIIIKQRYPMIESDGSPGSKVLEARKKLEGILKKAETEGYSSADVALLPSAKNLLNLCGASSEKSSRYRSLIVIAGILATVIYTTGIYTAQGFSNFWLRWNHGNVKDQMCTIPMPDELVKIFRPPASCSICQGVDKVEKVSNLPPEVFEERYAYSGRPVVITDGMTNWTAQHVFDFEFFKKIYTMRMDQWRLYNCQFFPYNTEFRHLSEVFNMSEERAFMEEGTEPWYVGWSNCDDEINQILRRHYEKPYFLPETAETKKLDWIFMGSSGYGAPMHVDNVEHSSWQAQLRGRKKWSLQPPPECFYECNSLQVVVEPGEIIVLDTNRWYHSTLIVSKEMSITIGAEYD